VPIVRTYFRVRERRHGRSFAAKVRMNQRLDHIRYADVHNNNSHQKTEGSPMRHAKLPLRLLLISLVAGCASTPPVSVREQLAPGSEIAVVMFRDCTIAEQEDCNESGLTAGSIFARVLSAKPGLRAVPLSRPVAPTSPLDDAAAVADAKSKGYAYVLNGEVEDYYRVAPMTFRVERAGVSVRLLRVSDGHVLAFFSHRTHSQTNLTTPDALLEKLADHFGEAIEPR
jgi:hypothetical protein